MNHEIILESINDNRLRLVLTICGSANYLSIKSEVETSKEIEEEIANRLADIHDYKIRQSIAIIVVTDDNGYYGSHTAREIEYAKERGCEILYTHIAESEMDKYYFNNDQTYPLYILKEE